MEIIGEEKFDIIVSIRYIYIYIFLEEASSSWLLVSREKESLFHLSFECIIYSIMRGPLEHYFSESSTCSYPEKRNDLYPLREERKLAETRRFLFPFSFFFFLKNILQNIYAV